MERKAKNRKIISGIMLILSCFTLMACKNAKLSLSSSTQSLEAATEEAIIPSESYTEEESSDSTVLSDILDRYSATEQKEEQSFLVSAREAWEEGEEKQKFQKQIESEVGKEIEIQIHFKNLHETVVENVWLKAEIENAELDYILGSTLLYNSNAQEGKAIEDGILGEGVNIGSYNASGDAYLRFRCKIIAAGRKEYGGNIKVSGNMFDGKDYQADWASIYTKNSAIQIKQTTKLKDSEGQGVRSLDAKVGDGIEFCIEYTNNSAETVENVVVSVSLPSNMEYVPGSTRLKNQKFLDGASTKDDTITTDGINIGNYASGEKALVKYSAVIVDKDLSKGTNQLITWTKISAGGVANNDFADVYVRK